MKFIKSLHTRTSRLNCLQFLICLFFLTGCAMTPWQDKWLSQAKTAISERNYYLAYNFLVDLFNSHEPGVREEALALARANPAIISAGENSLSLHLIDKAKGFSANDLASPTNFREAVLKSPTLSDRIARHRILDPTYDADKAIKATFAAHSKEILATIAAADKAKKEQEANAIVGVVLNVQVIDQSTAATSAGANLGSALGQASYIDSTGWRNYRATTQLGAGIVGAIVGSMADAKATKSYKLIYFIKRKNGEVTQVELSSNEQTYIPPGVCVEVIGSYHITVTNQNKCT